MTKKRFIKLLMSIGYDRDMAIRYAKFRGDASFKEDWEFESHALNNAKIPKNI